MTDTDRERIAALVSSAKELLARLDTSKRERDANSLPTFDYPRLWWLQFAYEQRRFDGGMAA